MKKSEKYLRAINNFKILKDEPLKKYTYFKIGGMAQFFALPRTTKELIVLLEQAKACDLDVTIIGGGTNILIKDKGIKGLVITTRQMRDELKLKEKKICKTILCASAGQSLGKICQFAMKNNLAGFEFTAGIPGTLGGAIMMNAGTRDKSMSDVVESIVILDQKNFKIKKIKRKNLDFKYRKLVQKGIIVNVRLQLKICDKKKIKKTYQKNLIEKHSRQPINMASAGCFFKNPSKNNPAGKLIENAGLKGMKINDAMVSKKHANFIVNLGNASFKDVILIKKYIQKVIEKKYNIHLKPEVIIK